MVLTNGITMSSPNIIDIRREELDESLLKLVLTCLDSDSNGPRTLPTLLLYDGVCTRVAYPSFRLHERQRLD